MTYAGIHMFMTELYHLINCTDNPLVNNPSIICERTQFQLLYDELDSMMQTLFIDQHQHLHDLKKVKDLKRRFTDAAEEAQYIVDLFLSGVHIRNATDEFLTSDDINPSLNLDDVRRSLNSIKVEFMSVFIDSMNMDSCSLPDRTLDESPAGDRNSFTRNSKGSKKLLDEIIVGIDRDAELIIEKLVDDQKKVVVVCIVGMGGIGKTTLASKVFNDGYVKHHFHVCVWVTVSQTYGKRDVLIQILDSMGVKLDLEKASDSRLRELVHKYLMGKRYLIVIDDIWDIETWDNIKLFFPHNKSGSRVLLTTRITEVAKHANTDGFIHHLGYLNKEKSWELLCQKVFHGNECPQWSIKPGMHIVESCQGLPLAVVVIAGVLAKEAWNEKFWVEIAERTGSYIVGDENGCMETLSLSYNHLPLHLRDCFLYLGGFLEDHKFQVERLIWLWLAEGFIQQDGNKSLEDIAEGYLMDLIDRNLVVVADRRNSNGAVIACKVHDLVRELCLRKAKEERFILKIERLIMSSRFSDVITQPYKPVRIFINKDINSLGFPFWSSQNLRSLLCFSNFRPLGDDIAKCSNFRPLGDDIAKCFRSFVLLRVLDLQKWRLSDLPHGMELLVHLRYLAIWNSSAGFPSKICNLLGLQTLIYITEQSSIVLPSNISDLVSLRHLWSFRARTGESLRIRVPFFLPSIEKPMNLQTISNVALGDVVDNFQRCFPYIKELTCTTYFDEKNDFKSLTYLEKLKLNVHIRAKSTMHDCPKGEPKNHIMFPATLKTLTLGDCRLPWAEMSIIQSLPNLQVLKLRRSAFEGSCWNTDKHVFRQLKFLRLKMLDIKLWKAYSPSFPSLRQLEIFHCYHLEGIPLDIGEIPTLEIIKIKYCRHSVGETVRRIQVEQHDFGNYDLMIDVTPFQK